MQRAESKNDTILLRYNDSYRRECRTVHRKIIKITNKKLATVKVGQTKKCLLTVTRQISLKVNKTYVYTSWKYVTQWLPYDTLQKRFPYSLSWK